MISDRSTPSTSRHPTAWHISLGLALVWGLLAGGLCLLMRQNVYPGPGDFNWALDTARALLAGRDPYAFEPSPLLVPYPLPVALFGLPVSGMPDPLAAALFFGISSALLAYGIARSGEPWRLLIFVTPVYFYALMFAQWSPLIVASWFFPVLAPLLTLIKPQVALPIALNRLTRPGLLLAGVVLGVSLLVYPTWPWRWLAMTGDYRRLIPILTLPSGWVLLAALLYWRDERAHLLLGMAVLPFRASYDLLALWLVPRTPWQMWMLAGLSWLPLFISDQAFDVQPEWSVPLLFVPCLLFVIFNARREQGRTISLFARRILPPGRSVGDAGRSSE
ncbi:MAG: hypothetical protein ACPL8I_09175 [Chloroflexaceae bacterium]